jgi:hypothetical protein
LSPDCPWKSWDIAMTPPFRRERAKRTALRMKKIEEE